MRAILLICVLFLRAHAECAGKDNGEMACNEQPDSSILLQAKVQAHFDSEILEDEDMDEDQDAEEEVDEDQDETVDEVAEVSSNRSLLSVRSDRTEGTRFEAYPTIPGYKYVGQYMCRSGKPIVGSFVGKGIDGFQKCAQYCDQLRGSNPQCTAFQSIPSTKKGGRCSLFSECNAHKTTMGGAWSFYAKDPAQVSHWPEPPSVTTPVGPPPKPDPPVPSGCSGALDVSLQQRLHVSTVCLPEKVGGAVHGNVFNGPSPMSQVGDRSSADTMYFSWTADREWGFADSDGMDGRVYVSKMKISKGGQASLVKSTPFDGFVRASGLDITDEGVVGTLCAKWWPAWAEGFGKKGKEGQISDHSPMPLALCEVNSDMSKRGIPWQIGRQFQWTNNAVASFWGTFPVSGWFEQRSAGYGELAYDRYHKTWAAWYGANVGSHTGYGIHIYPDEGKILDPEHPLYSFFDYPLPANQMRIKTELTKRDKQLPNWPGNKFNVGTKENPRGFPGREGTGDHQAGAAWRYHPLVHDVGLMKHAHKAPYMQRLSMETPKGGFIGRSTKGQKLWWIGHSWGRVEMKGQFGEVKREGGIRACGRDWIAAVVAADGNVCMKVSEEGAFISRTVIESSYVEKDQGTSLARIAPLGSSEDTAACGADATFLFGYEKADNSLWLVEVDGNCNVKSQPQDVTAHTQWPLHSDWSTTIDGSVFWVTAWQGDSSVVTYSAASRGPKGARLASGALYGKTPGANNRAKVTVYYPSAVAPTTGTTPVEPAEPAPSPTPANEPSAPEPPAPEEPTPANEPSAPEPEEPEEPEPEEPEEPEPEEPEEPAYTKECKVSFGKNFNGGKKCVDAGAPAQCASDAGDRGKRVADWNLQKTANDRFDITTTGAEVCAERTDGGNGKWWFVLEIMCQCAE